jgi:hypothetical protein
MTKRLLLFVAALTLWPTIAGAHDVPDRVRIDAFVKVDGGRVVLLIRVPANALIDYWFPTLPGAAWVDLPGAEGFATDGAKVWIADRVTVYDDTTELPKPQLLAVRISRVNDPSFGAFESALAGVSGMPLPPDTLAVQDQLTVDALLQIPLTSSPDGRFSIETRFGRLGVMVDTTLTFLPVRGGIRQFQYRGDPGVFALDPGPLEAIAHFVKAGAAAYFSGSDYMLVALCVAVAFRRARSFLPFVAALISTEIVLILAAPSITAQSFWLRGLVGVLISSITVYLGIEAIVARDDRRTGVGLITGLILGGGFWLALQPILQFGGVHPLTSSVAFYVGIVSAEFATLALCFGAVQIVHAVSQASRGVDIIAAAIAIHLSWRRMLERADGLALVPQNDPGRNPMLLAFLAGAAIAALLLAAIYTKRRRVMTA